MINIDLYELGMRLSFLRKFRLFPKQWSDIFNWDDIALEIGCGTGDWSMIPKEKHNIVIGLEISKHFLILQHKNKKNRMTHNYCDHLICASADYMPFKDKIIDVAYSCDVIHHIPLQIQERFFKECKRVIKKYYLPLEMKLKGFPLIFTTIADELQKLIWGYNYNYDRSLFFKNFKFLRYRKSFMYDWFLADCNDDR
ncbi:MAG: class I SAM-dependent methyltransferase [Candidatus Helarchaeota archaeon]